VIGRVVYDTMIFLQAAVRPGRVHRTFQAVADGTVTLCVSNDLLKEVRDVLTRDTVRAKFPALTTEAVDAFLDG
jgi:predicted nucleic acid-binding protein